MQKPDFACRAAPPDIGGFWVVEVVNGAQTPIAYTDSGAFAERIANLLAHDAGWGLVSKVVKRRRMARSG